MEENKCPTKKDIKCPICGGTPNSMYFDSASSTDTMASFICECWSGEVEEKSNYHFFRAKIFNLPVLEVDKEE